VKLKLELSSPSRLHQVASAEARGRQQLAREVSEALDPVLTLLDDEREPADEETLAEIAGLLPEEGPGDVEEALILAMERFPATLTITEAAERSAMQMNRSVVPVRRLWSALLALDQVAAMWQRDELTAAGKDGALKDLGFTVGHVSDPALGRNRHHYFFTHDGRQVHVDQHLRLSRRYRIYWYESEEERRIVINHIGAHLPNA
jgi:hypothetical protein